MNNLSDLAKIHAETFGGTPSTFKAPGRVNLIGEHTDYNDGYVLPTPLNRHLEVAIKPRSDNVLRLHAVDFDEQTKHSLSSLQFDKKYLWANYVQGVVQAVQSRGYKITGFDLSITGNVPLGVGLSSSAALETAIVRAISNTFNLNIDPVEMAYIGKQCENEFVGVQSGIMDQFVSGLGVYCEALFVDCRTNEHSLHKLHPDFKVVIVNTMMSRELAGSEYNVRKAQCEEAVSIIKKEYPEVEALRDVSEEMLLSSWHDLSDLVARRARHVVTENNRVLEAVKALDDGDMWEFGSLMYDSHDSLRHDYEVTSRELDLIVDSTLYLKGVLGSRMTGAGFGGCTVNLVENEYVEEFAKTVSNRYFRETEIVPDVYIA